MISEWDPILTPNLAEYAWLRLNEGRMELRFASHPDYTIFMDAKAIPQMIKILERMNTNLLENDDGRQI